MLDTLQKLSPIVAAGAAIIAAVFAGLTWRVYLRMNRILAATNSISEAMVRESERSRLQSVAPMLELRLSLAVRGPTPSLGVESIPDEFALHVLNRGPGVAHAVRAPQALPSTNQGITLVVDATTHYMIHTSRIESRSISGRVKVECRDVYGNAWESELFDGATFTRLVSIRSEGQDI